MLLIGKPFISSRAIYTMAMLHNQRVSSYMDLPWPSCTQRRKAALATGKRRTELLPPRRNCVASTTNPRFTWQGHGIRWGLGGPFCHGNRSNPKMAGEFLDVFWNMELHGTSIFSETPS
jgi:hypothetical protein